MLNLKGHADKSYDTELEQLYESIVTMGKRVAEVINLARTALLNSSASKEQDLTAQAKLIDKEINGLELDIEKRVIAIITRRQPFLQELRFVTSALKIATTLERIGDMAKNTVKRAARLPSSLPTGTAKDFDAMIQVITEMLAESLVIFKDYDEAQAIAICKRDDEVDAYYRALFNTIQKEMAADSGLISLGTHIIFAAKNLERMADHVTNLAKIVYYIHSGAVFDKKMLAV